MKTPGKFVSKMNRPALANARHQVLTAVPATKLALVGPMALLKVKHIYLTHAHFSTYEHAWEGAQTPLKSSYP